VELVADRPRLDAAHPRQEQRGEQLLIAGAGLDPVAHLFQQAVAGGVLDEPDQGLDVGTDLDAVGKSGARCCFEPGQRTEKGKVAQAGHGAAGRRRHESSSGDV
jgi:hypothetical protein